MATLLACANGNLTNAATWALVDATSLLISQAQSVALSTTVQRSSTFTPGAITIDGIAVWLAIRSASPSGTMTVRLDQGVTPVAGTTVTINVSDLPLCTTGGPVGGAEGGWHFFMFAAPVLLVAATAYSVACSTSVNSQVTLYRDATAANFCRMLRTTTTQAPIAGDNMYLCEEKTGAGAATARSVTMDSTAATDYGSGVTTRATGTITPALCISKGGTLVWGTAAATNYILQLSGWLVIYAGGVHNMGTTGTPCPRDSSMTLQFDCAANDEFGEVIYNLSAETKQGQSRSVGKDHAYCLLAANAAIAATTLTVDRDTGWLDNDVIAIGSTTRTPGQREIGALNGNAGSGSLTVDGFAGAGGGVAFAHDGGGTDPYVVAEVINLTRNVVVRAVNPSFRTNIFIQPTAQVDWDWVQHSYLGGPGGNVGAGNHQPGIGYATTTGSFSMSKCSYHEGSGIGIQYGSASNNNFEFIDLVLYNATNGSANGFNIGTISGTNWKIDGLWTIGGTGQAASVAAHVDIGCLNAQAATPGITNLRISSVTANAQLRMFHPDNTYIPEGRVTNIVSHSGAGDGFSQDNSGFYNGWVTDLQVWQMSVRMGGAGSAYGTMIVKNGVFFGFASQNMITSVGSNYIFINPIIAGSTLQACQQVFQRNGSGVIIVNGGSIGKVTGVRTAITGSVCFDNQSPYQQDWYFNGVDITSSSGTARITSPTNLDQNRMAYDVGIHAQGCLLNGSPYTSSMYVSGNVVQDNSFFRTATPSERLEPRFCLVAADPNFKQKSSSRLIAVNSGDLKTVSCWVYKDATYVAAGGVQPRLILKANGAVGVNEDQVLDTMSVGSGSWEQLIGVLPAATADGAFEVYVDCGTSVVSTAMTGNVWTDDWEVA